MRGADFFSRLDFSRAFSEMRATNREIPITAATMMKMRLVLANARPMIERQV